MPVVPRQIIGSLISEALQSRISTASVGLFESSTPAAVTTTRAVLPSIPTPPVVTLLPTTSAIVSLLPVVSSTSEIVSQTPTVSVITFTTTTSTPVTTTQAVTSSSSLSSTVPALTLTTPAASSQSSAVPVPTTTRAALTPSASATGASSNAGNAQDSNSMGGGIIALIIVGALLAALLAGAFAFRRIQVHRRAKRRENNYGAGAIPEAAPFPFTNVSESDLKGAQSIRDFRQGSVTSQFSEKPLPTIVPDPYPLGANVYAQPAYNDGMSGPYPMVGAGAYGYGQNRTASPAPSQPPRMMSPAPPPAAFTRAVSPANPYPVHPQSLTPAMPAASLTVPVPAAGLSVPQVSGKKRVIQTFQPSLPDELDIRDGDWVTVVHAYDDGWGLCECNGRRGVVPLECLDPGKPDFRASRRLSSLSAIRP